MCQDLASSSTGDLEPILSWLLTEGRLIAAPVPFFAGLGRALKAADFPVDRMRFATRTLHPLVMAWNVTWTAADDRTTQETVPHGTDKTPAFLGSPIAAIYEQRQIVRQRLNDELVPGRHHTIYFELREDGYTDYLGVPVPFQDGTANALILATRHPAGFSDPVREQLVRLALHLGPILELHAVRHTSRGLLDTYVGPRSGARVLHGTIRRGEGEVIDAVLWFSDLRDFTQFAEVMPITDTLGLLNLYFETVYGAVTAGGGEVLDFVGDGMLVLFPLDDGNPKTVAGRAIEAARTCLAKLAEVNRERSAAGQPPIRLGIGLHCGRVIYGNLGAPQRLHFGVIGAAVNRTARLEALSKDLGEPLVLSADFAAALDQPVRSHGHFQVKGIAQPIEVFSPATPLDQP